jgi:hypothetical protein
LPRLNGVTAVALTSLLAIGLSTVPTQQSKAVIPSGWEVSYADPGVEFQATDLTSLTMVTETFDDDNAWGFGCCSNIYTGSIAGVGDLSGYGMRYRDDYYWGGAGAVGGFAQAGDLTVHLHVTHKYLGFWWSAGNADNNVTLLDVDNNPLGTFSTSDVISSLGSCPAVPVSTDYCGNPNFSGNLNDDPAKYEQFAYIHIRYEPGFDKVQIFGAGFEFDNLSFSQTVPSRSGTEQSVTTDEVVLNCSSVDAVTASQSVIACPRTVVIGRDQSLVYSPLSESQITGYSYPESYFLSGSQVSEGVGEQVRTGSQITLSSGTVGTFLVNFTVSDGESTSTSRIEVLVEEISIAVPMVVLFDPRATEVALPEMPLFNSTNALLCLSQVADSEATEIQSSTVSIESGSYLAGITPTLGSNTWEVSGSIGQVSSQSGLVRIRGFASQKLSTGSPIFIKVSASPAISFGSAACESPVQFVVELKPLGLDLEQKTTIDLN